MLYSFNEVKLWRLSLILPGAVIYFIPEEMDRSAARFGYEMYFIIPLALIYLGTLVICAADLIRSVFLLGKRRLSAPGFVFRVAIYLVVLLSYKW